MWQLCQTASTLEAESFATLLTCLDHLVLLVTDLNFAAGQIAIATALQVSGHVIDGNSLADFEEKCFAAIVVGIVRDAVSKTVAHVIAFAVAVAAFDIGMQFVDVAAAAVVEQLDAVADQQLDPDSEKEQLDAVADQQLDPDSEKEH